MLTHLATRKLERSSHLLLRWPGVQVVRSSLSVILIRVVLTTYSTAVLVLLASPPPPVSAYSSLTIPTMSRSASSPPSKTTSVRWPATLRTRSLKTKAAYLTFNGLGKTITLHRHSSALAQTCRLNDKR